jgi:hypothetical protein
VPPTSETVPEYLTEAIAFYNNTHYRYVQFYPPEEETFPSTLRHHDEEDLSEDPPDEGMFLLVVFRVSVGTCAIVYFSIFTDSFILPCFYLWS